MQVLIYEQEKMIRAGQLLNSLSVSGSSNFRALAELADILDSGIAGEMSKEKKEEKGREKGGRKDGLEHKEVCSD